ncbi:MAG TPA: hypothetical protein VKE74_12580 [Gemmataceae bacterium]|nr:hypothetical protein [Gemmataceae bacterium]
MPKSTESSPAPAASPAVAVAVPNYEVKMFLDSAKVLTVEFKPTKDADRVFNLTHPSRKITMQFLDARPHQLHQEGWNVRLRRFDGTGEVELSYKRRYRIAADEPFAEALAKAAHDGFTAAEKDYAAQVEWGFERQRLSFTRKKLLKAKGLGELELPGLADTRAVVVRELPGKLDRQKQAGWARGLLTDGHLYGPVLGKRYAGQWQGPDLDFEVWLVRTESGQGVEPVVELSFKADERADAGGFRDKLLHFVRDHGWLLETDVLKTDMILKRY